MRCTRCGNNIYLQCSDDTPHKIDGLPYCDECYFDELGKIIELHPIGLPPYIRF